jgi:hypothetical protein
MKKLLILLLSASLFISCNNNKDQGGGGLNNNNNNRGGWSNAEKSKFMNDCVNGGGNKQLCSCVLGKLQRKYRNMQEADRVGGEAAGQQLAMECQQGNRGGNDDNNWNDDGGGGNNDDNNWNDDGGGGNNDDNMNDNNRGDNDNDNMNDNSGGGFSRSGGSWSGSDKSKFMNDCISGGGTQQLCSCVLGKLQRKFKGMAEADRIGGAAEGERLGQECRNQGGM